MKVARRRWWIAIVRLVLMPLWWPLDAVFSRIERHFENEAAVAAIPRLGAIGVEEAAFAPLGRSVAALIATLSAMLVALVVWSALCEIDILASASGKVIPASTVQQLSTLDGGVLTELQVKEGDRVARGQVLALLSPVVAQSAVTERQASREGLLASIARLEAEAENRPPAYPDELRPIAGLVDDEERVRASRSATLAATLEVFRQQRRIKAGEQLDFEGRLPQFERSLQLLSEQIARVEPLVRSGSVAPIELMALQREQAGLQAQLVSIRQGIVQSHDQMGESDRRMQEKLSAFRGDAREELARKQTQLKSLVGELSGRQELLQRTVIRSPVDGLVKTLHVTTIGAAVGPGKNIVDVVPINDTLLIEARVSAQDIAYVRLGLPAKVRITAFDSGALGTLTGVVDFISPDSQTDERTGAVYYRIQARTASHSVGNVNILPGMVAEVDVITGRRTVMGFVLRPVARALARSLSER
ncbi:MAG: type secretion rane fusion protein HlyD family [Rhizobacter sp.]|nr:type secretion rane fusion protein HlyD family [Rhizobacter sp.]